MSNLDIPIFDIDRGHMRFAAYGKPGSDDILFVFKCAEQEAEVGAVLTPEELLSEESENVFGFVIHGKDCAETIAEVISSIYAKIEQREKELNERPVSENL